MKFQPNTNFWNPVSDSKLSFTLHVEVTPFSSSQRCGTNTLSRVAMTIL